jgi:hypothetical protein
MKIRLLFCLLFLLFCLCKANAQSGQKMATARIVEGSSVELSRIVIVYETGTNEVVPLKNIKLFSGTASAAEVLLENQTVITRVLNEMSAKGYELVQMSGGGENMFQNLFVFAKR